MIQNILAILRGTPRWIYTALAGAAAAALALAARREKLRSATKDKIHELDVSRIEDLADARVRAVEAKKEIEMALSSDLDEVRVAEERLERAATPEDVSDLLNRTMRDRT